MLGRSLLGLLLRVNAIQKFYDQMTIHQEQATPADFMSNFFLQTIS